ncbi:MAG: F0F1 ATP synthase subunit gamma [Vicinamibacterales bacterium]|nr:F0F1 ATP synthase subunit gamma [Vicinamibacterales bacterium]
MQTPDAVKRRLDTFEDLRSVVRTMKALAAVSLRQYEEAVASLGEYTRMVDLGLQVLLRERPAAIAGQGGRPTRRHAAIVFGSDQGLCGSFNDQITAFVVEAIGAPGAPDGPRLAVGARVAGRLEEAGRPAATVLAMPASAPLITPLVQELLAWVDARRAAGECDGVDLYFNRPQGGAAFRPHHAPLLPLDRARLRALAARPWPSRSRPAFRTDWHVLFAACVREHLFVTLHRAVAESLVSENASRLAAMHAAERNIDERLGALRTEFHLQRQTAITTELLDIVSGFEVLSS